MKLKTFNGLTAEYFGDNAEMRIHKWDSMVTKDGDMIATITIVIKELDENERNSETTV